MPANLRRHGYKGDVLLDPSGGSTHVTVASLNGWTLDAKRDRADVTAFGDPNKVKVQGLPDYTGTIKGWWEATETRKLFDVALGDVAVGLKLVPSTLDPTYFFSGLAYVDANIDVSADGAITVGGSWAAAGAWELDPAAP